MEPENNVDDDLNAEKENLESPVDIADEGEQAVSDSAEVAIVDLQAELDKANAKAAENWEKVLLATAEVENIRRRSQKDLENAHRFAVEKFAKDLLAVVDSFEMGLSAAESAPGDVTAIKEGMELTYKQLMTALEKAKLVQVDPQDEPFNPSLHQAMTMVPSEEHAHNTVIQVFQKGYTLNDRLLRPAMVVVSQGGATNKEPEQTKKIDEQA